MRKAKIYPWYFAIGAVLIYTILSVVPGLIGVRIRRRIRGGCGPCV